MDPFEHESVSEGTSPSKWVPKHEYGGGRWPIRLQVLLHAMAARCDDLAFGDYKEVDKLEKTDGRWLHAEEVSKVKIFLSKQSDDPVKIPVLKPQG